MTFLFGIAEKDSTIDFARLFFVVEIVISSTYLVYLEPVFFARLISDESRRRAIIFAIIGDVHAPCGNVL